MTEFSDLHRRLQKPQKKPRVSNAAKKAKEDLVKTGKGFPSDLEKLTMVELTKSSSISDIRRQSSVELTRARIRCKVDFCVWNKEHGRNEWHEAKGILSDRWVIFEKLWHFYGPGVLHVWEMTDLGPKVARTIHPKSLV